MRRNRKSCVSCANDWNGPAAGNEHEFFLLSNDIHDLERFTRRRLEPISGSREVYVASVEDVIITKLRWSKGGNRKKDVDDVRNVIPVSGASVDWPYVERWCEAHGTRELLDRVRAEAVSEPESYANERTC